MTLHDSLRSALAAVIVEPHQAYYKGWTITGLDHALVSDARPRQRRVTLSLSFDFTPGTDVWTWVVDNLPNLQRTVESAARALLPADDPRIQLQAQTLALAAVSDALAEVQDRLRAMTTEEPT